jgi:hypothetical protein
MTMPKAAVNEDRLPARWENDIGGAGQIPTMQSKSVAERMEQTTHRQLRGGVLSANARHERAPALWGPVVCHGTESHFNEMSDLNSAL